VDHSHASRFVENKDGSTTKTSCLEIGSDPPLNPRIETKVRSITNPGRIHHVGDPRGMGVYYERGTPVRLLVRKSGRIHHVGLKAVVATPDGEEASVTLSLFKVLPSPASLVFLTAVWWTATEICRFLDKGWCEKVIALVPSALDSAIHTARIHLLSVHPDGGVSEPCWLLK